MHASMQAKVDYESQITQMWSSGPRKTGKKANEMKMLRNQATYLTE
jgi:hypothetical protein